MAARALILEDWEIAMAKIPTSAATGEILAAIGEVNTLVAEKFGVVQASLSTLSANQDALRSTVMDLQGSLKELRQDVGAKATRQDVTDLDSRIARDMMRFDADKISRREFNLKDFEALGDLVENLGARIDEMHGKLDSIGKIESVVQSNQMRLEQVEIEMKPLTAAKNEVAGWEKAIRYALWPLIMGLCYLVGKLPFFR